MSTPGDQAIGAALRHVRMSGIFYCPSELTEPWGIELPPMEHCLWFHFVTSGAATVEVGTERIEARTGDLVLVPHGSGHRAWGTEPAPTPSVFDLPHDEVHETYALLRHGGGSARTDVVCGGVRLEHPNARHLLDALPAIVHVEASLTPRSDWTHATLDLMADELRQVRAGADAVVSRLCDILVIQAIRTWIEREGTARTGWIGALRDDQIGAAIAAIHQQPGAPWTVASLAEVAAMSRSAFAARFAELVGEPAMTYVTRWRMHQALDLLERTDGTVASIGRSVGYDSEAAFSRAFKRVTGTSPRDARVA